MSLLNRQERLLLSAALQRGPLALRAWEEWRQSCPLNDDIDVGFHRLIPLLHHNLCSQGVIDPELSGYAAVRRFYWLRNQVFLREAERILCRFGSAGIRSLVLKGVGLAITVYPKPELRPLTDLDILVCPDDALRAIGLLNDLDFHLSNQHPASGQQSFEALFRSHHAHSFRRSGEYLSIDLHTRLHNPVPSLVLVQQILDEALPLNIGNANTSIAQPTVQVLHAIVHGSRRGGYPRPSLLRWAADVAMLRYVHDREIDWHGLAELARRHECLTLFQNALDDVAVVMDKPLPATAISAFRTRKPTVRDTMEWSIRRMSLFNLGFPFGHFLDCRRFRQADREQNQPPRAFSRFFADRLQLKRESEMPHALLAKILQHLLRVFKYRGVSGQRSRIVP